MLTKTSLKRTVWGRLFFGVQLGLMGLFAGIIVPSSLVSGKLHLAIVSTLALAGCNIGVSWEVSVVEGVVLSGFCGMTSYRLRLAEVNSISVERRVYGQLPYNVISFKRKHRRTRYLYVSGLEPEKVRSLWMAALEHHR